MVPNRHWYNWEACWPNTLFQPRQSFPSLCHILICCFRIQQLYFYKNPRAMSAGAAHQFSLDENAKTTLVKPTCSVTHLLRTPALKTICATGIFKSALFGLHDGRPNSTHLFSNSFLQRFRPRRDSSHWDELVPPCTWLGDSLASGASGIMYAQSA